MRIFTQLAFYVNLHRAVIGPSATLTGRWRPDIDLRRMLTGSYGSVVCSATYALLVPRTIYIILKPMTSNQYSKIFYMLKSYDKHGPFYHMLMCLNQYWKMANYSSWSDVWSRSTRFAQAYVFNYLVLSRHIISDTYMYLLVTYK